MKIKLLTKILSAIVALCVFLSGISAFAFSDTKGHTYENAANFISEKGIIKGYGDGTFRPQNNITRAEAAVIICRVAGKEKSAEKNTAKKKFSDVSSGHWASCYINYASGELKILNGYSDGTFKPDNTLSWDEAVKIIVCLLGAEDEAAMYPPYSNWAECYYQVGISRGYLTNIKIYKGRPIKRGELAEIVSRAFYSAEYTPYNSCAPSGTTKGDDVVKNYSGSMAPSYTSVTGCRENVPGLSYSYGGAIVRRYFYKSNEADVEKYSKYMQSIGWEKSGPVTEPGDTRGECTLIGFAHYDQNKQNDAYVQVYRFHSDNSVDVIVTERLPY